MNPKSLILNQFVSATLFLVAAEARSFTDDLNVTHTFSGKPTIVTWAHTAIALYHLGMGLDQLKGTYGERVVSGSDMDFKNLTRGSSFAADPTPEELELLDQITNLSPSCGAEYCEEFDLELFQDVDPDFVLVHGYRHEAWAIDDIIRTLKETYGKPVIYIEISQQGENCRVGHEKKCYGKSMIEVMDRYYQLAVALGVGIPQSVNADRRDLCIAAANFQEAAEIAHTRGVRVLAAYLTSSVAFIGNPSNDVVLRMFEELGMPIMYPGLCSHEDCSMSFSWETIPITQWFPDCEEGQDLSTCNENSLYPVDFWLYDHRNTLTAMTDKFKEGFPDKAFRAKQYASWPVTGRTLSYKQAAEILNNVAPEIAEAEALHPRTDCKENVDVSAPAHRLVGLEGGEYACYDERFQNLAYLSCDLPRSIVFSDPEDGMSKGAKIGYSFAAIIGFILICLVVCFCCCRGSNELDKDLEERLN